MDVCDIPSGRLSGGPSNSAIAGGGDSFNRVASQEQSPAGSGACMNGQQLSFPTLMRLCAVGPKNDRPSELRQRPQPGLRPPNPSSDTAWRPLRGSGLHTVDPHASLGRGRGWPGIASRSAAWPSIPFSNGIATSRIATSGLSSSARLTASRPIAGLCDHNPVGPRLKYVSKSSSHDVVVGEQNAKTSHVMPRVDVPTLDSAVRRSSSHGDASASARIHHVRHLTVVFTLFSRL